MPFQFMQQGQITEILLQVDRTGFVDEEDFRYGTAAIAKMAAEINERAVLADIVVIGGDIGTVGRMQTEIHAIASGLGYLFQLGKRRRAIRCEQFLYVVDNSLHGRCLVCKNKHSDREKK